MKIKFHHLPPLLLLLLWYNTHQHNVQAQSPSTIGYTCTANQSSSPCDAYVFYRAAPPDFLDLAAVGDLFSLSRPEISSPSNISSPTSRLLPGQTLFIPIKCSCNIVNTSVTIYYSPQNFTIRSGDTFYLVSASSYQNLTTYQSMEVVNPNLVPTQLDIGVVKGDVVEKKKERNKVIVEEEEREEESDCVDYFTL